MAEICEQEEKQLERMKKIMDIVEMFEVRTTPSTSIPLTLEDCAAQFRNLQEDFYVEYKMYDLSSLAVAVVFPMVRATYMYMHSRITLGLENIFFYFKGNHTDRCTHVNVKGL